MCEPQIEQKAVAAIGTRTIVLSLDHRHPKTMATPIIEPNLNVDANSHGHWLSIWYTFIHSNCVCVCVSHSIWAHHFQIKWGFCHLFAISESETLLTLLPLYWPFSAYRNMFQCWMMCALVFASHIVTSMCSFICPIKSLLFDFDCLALLCSCSTFTCHPLVCGSIIFNNKICYSLNTGKRETKCLV